MKGSAKLPPTAVCIGLFIAIALDTVVQIIWKTAASHVDLSSDVRLAFWQALCQPLFWAVGATMLLQLFNWRRVLEKADLSFAQPITSLSYVSVLILSAVLLHERITVSQVCGVILILVGVVFISRTEHNTSAPTAPVEP
jgi:drug/metabolite transporter (DMT)-like permease